MTLTEVDMHLFNLHAIHCKRNKRSEILKLNWFSDDWLQFRCNGDEWNSELWVDMHVALYPYQKSNANATQFMIHVAINNCLQLPVRSCKQIFQYVFPNL